MKMNNRGMTLVEILVTVGIVAILTVAVGFQFAGWKARYEVEKAIRDLYSSLSDARTRAMQTSRAHFFDISTNGRFYRVTDDDSNGVADAANGDGIFQQQATWAAIQASQPLNWGADTPATDTTINQLSRRVDLTNNPPAGWTALNSTRHAGLLTALFITPSSGGWPFRLGFDKRGLIRIMILSNPWAFPPSTDISNSVSFEQWIQWVGAAPWGWGNPTICIFTDYDGNGTSDSDPDYDCVNITETKISLGKLTTQNTAGGLCVQTNCISK